MSKTILIVESDQAVVDSVRPELEQRGCVVEQTAEGKSCVDTVRRQRPAAVILAVELPAGQNGYLVCREIKKDDEIKSTPVVIIGSPEKFADHKKLRTHADEYIAKPLDVPDLIQRVGALIGGFPQEVEASPEETLNINDLMDESGESAEEISVEADSEVEGDPDLALLDSALGESDAALEEQVVVEEQIAETPVEEVPLTADDADVSEVEADDVLSALDDSPPPEGVESWSPEAQASEPAPAAEGQAFLSESREMSVSEEEPPPPTPLRTGPSADAAELRSLRARTAELQDLLERAETRASEAEERIGSLDSELTAKASELESLRQGGIKGDKDYFALREQANTKDKEILRLKKELNEKEQGELEMREREVQLEQKLSEQSTEMGRKDAQLKALTTRADALLSEKKRAESQAHSAREEARNATERANVAEEKAQEATQRAERLETELAEERAAHVRAQEDLGNLRNETADSRNHIEGLQLDLEDAKAQLMEQTTAFAEEGANLRARVAELEGQLTKHEERVAKLYTRIKGDEKLRERVKKALSIAAQLLDEPAGAGSEDAEGTPAGDEPRAA